MAFVSVNGSYILGKFNQRSYEDVCKVYLSTDKKSKKCIEYEEEKIMETSFLQRYLLVY